MNFFKDSTIWVVPVAQVPNWKKFFFIFTTNVWILSLLTYSIVSIVAYSLSIKEKKGSIFTSLPGILLVIYSITINNSIGKFPKSTRFRVFLFLYALFALHWTTAYSSNLISLMTSPKYTQQISSFDDILNYKFGFGMTLSTTRFFEKTNDHFEDEITRTINKNYELCQSAAECLEKIANEKYVGLTMS